MDTYNYLCINNNSIMLLRYFKGCLLFISALMVIFHKTLRIVSFQSIVSSQVNQDAAARRCQTEHEMLYWLSMTHHQLHATPAGGSVRRDVLPSGLDWGRTQMMGIIQQCGGGGSCKVLLVRLTARWLRCGGLAEELRAAWAPGITSAWRCVVVRPGDSPCERERGTPIDLS